MFYRLITQHPGTPTQQLNKRLSEKVWGGVKKGASHPATVYALIHTHRPTLPQPQRKVRKTLYKQSCIRAFLKGEAKVSQ